MLHEENVILILVCSYDVIYIAAIVEHYKISTE